MAITPNDAVVAQSHNWKPVEGSVEKLSTTSEYWLHKETVEQQIALLKSLSPTLAITQPQLDIYNSILHLLDSLNEVTSGFDGVVIESPDRGDAA